MCVLEYGYIIYISIYSHLPKAYGYKYGCIFCTGRMKELIVIYEAIHHVKRGNKKPQIEGLWMETFIHIFLGWGEVKVQCPDRICM